MAFDARTDASAIAVALAGGVVQLKFAPAESESARKDNEMSRMPANFRVFKREPPKREVAWNRAFRRFGVVDPLDLVLDTGDAPEIVGMIDELDRIGKLHATVTG
jgi:hypothetical protein